MKTRFLILGLLAYTMSFSQAQLGYSVPSISAMKTYSGTANRMTVTGTNQEFILCSGCASDEVLVYSGVGGRRWRKLTHTSQDITDFGNAVSVNTTVASKASQAYVLAERSNSAPLTNKYLNFDAASGNVAANIPPSAIRPDSVENFNPATKQDIGVDNSTTYALSLLGSPITNLGFGSPYMPYPGTVYGHDMYLGGEVTWTALPVANTVQITGLKYQMYRSGAYTAQGFNGIGLYSITGGVLTLVASSANLPNLWKTAPNTVITIPFTAPYTLQPGLYYTAAIYNASAETVTPQLMVNSGSFSPELNNTGFAFGRFINGKGSYALTLPSTFNTSAVIKTNAPDPTWVAAYK